MDIFDNITSSSKVLCIECSPDTIELINTRTKLANIVFKSQDEYYFLKGNIVITSYTLPWLISDGIKIWLSGSIENSSKRMSSRDNTTLDEALVIVKKRFEENKIIYKKLYGFNFSDDLTVFDKIIETDGLDINQVLEIAKTTVSELF